MCFREGEFGRRIPKIEDISRPVQIVDKGLPAAHPLQRAYPEVKSQYSLTPMVGESCKSDYLMTVSSCVKLETDNSQEEALRKNAIKYHACNKCSMKFPLETMLHRHKMTHDLRRIVLKARHQGRSSFHQFHPRRTSNIVLQKHRKNHQNHEYNCTLCDFRSSKKIILSAHTKTMHQIRVVKSNLEKAAAYGNNVECSVQVKKRKKVASKKIKHSNDAYCTCKHCDVQFKSSNALAAHASQCHPKSSRNTGRDEDCDSGQCNNYRSSKREKPQVQFYGNEMQQPSTTTFSCSGCKFQCKKRSTMTTHVAKKHIKNNLEEHCNLCDFKCSKKSTLYSHKRRHKLEANNEVYSCSECDFKTSKRTSLYSHIKRKHKIAKSCTGDDKPVFFYCTQCDYKNKNKYELKVHVARKHTDDFKFSCETCGKKFKVKGDLTNHIRFSHREQPVICDVCGKTCMNSNSLYVHQKFAHYKAKYECQICKRRMVTQENLNEHMLRQHEKRENVVCEECGKTFSRNSRLKVHMRIHTGDKPYTCTICKKAFARRTALKQHLLIHTGIRPYVCDICGKAFTQKPGLISHRKSHPGSHPPLPRVLIDHILNDVMKN